MGLEACVLSILLNRGKVRVEELLNECARAWEAGLVVCRGDLEDRLVKFIKNLEARGTVKIVDGYVILIDDKSLSPVLRKLLEHPPWSQSC